MPVHVVVAGKTFVKILGTILPAALLEGASLVNGGELNGEFSRAQTLLAVRHEPVALVMNANMTEPAPLSELRKDTEYLLKSVAGKVPVKLVLFVPSIEGVFFHDPATLHRLFGVLTGEQRMEARYNPRKVLAELLAEHESVNSIEQLLACLRPKEIEGTRSHPAIRELLAFLEQVAATVAV